jgi:hypothetical protein
VQSPQNSGDTNGNRSVSPFVVDDFGVKYIKKTDAEYLLAVLKQDYECDMDWEGTRYLGLAINWDYKNRKVHLSMPGYIDKALIRFNQPPPDTPQHQPHPHTVPTYGATIQYAKHIDQSPAATKADQKYIMQVVGVLLYYARAVNSTLLVALSSLASVQAANTHCLLTSGYSTTLQPSPTPSSHSRKVT